MQLEWATPLVLFVVVPSLKVIVVQVIVQLKPLFLYTPNKGNPLAITVLLINGVASAKEADTGMAEISLL